MYVHMHKRGRKGFGPSCCKTRLKEVKRRAACVMRLIIRRRSKLVLLCLKLESAEQIQRAVTGLLPAVKQAPAGVTFSPQTQKHVEEMTLSGSTRNHRASALPHAIWAGEALIGGWSWRITCSQQCQVGEDVTAALPSPRQSVRGSVLRCHPSLLRPLLQQGCGRWST